MTNKFVFGVANAWGYDDSGNILFSSKTLLDSSINSTISNVDVRGGYSNPLLAIYWHSPNMEITLTDTQWNLNFLAKVTGSTVTTGKNVYVEETVTLGADGAGTVVGTPVAYVGSTIYGWVTKADGTDETVTFSGKNFDSTEAEGVDVTVRYYALDAAARTMTVTSNFIPATVRLVLEAQLFSSDSAASRIGTVLFEFPKVTLSGAMQIQLKADGVSSTPLSARALAYTPSGATQAIFGYITEKLTSVNWYDNVIGLSIVGGDYAKLTTDAAHTLVVKAIHSDNTVSTVSNALLDFTSGTAGTATIGAHTGIVTIVGAGTTLLRAAITAKNTIDTSCTLTVTAP